LFLPLLGEGSVIRRALSAHAATESASLILAVDNQLDDLPWEGLSAFSCYRGHVVRDFSAHVTGHRLVGDMLTVQGDTVRIVADPFGDDSGNTMAGSERVSLAKHVGELCTAVPGGSGWQPLTAGPTPGSLCLHDWVTLGSGGSSEELRSVFVQTPGKLGGILSPRELGVLDLSRVVLFAAVDQGYNDSSYRRQNTGDNVKTQAEILSEQSSRMSVLLTLAGTRVIVQQSWAGTFMAQQRFSKILWTQLGAGSDVCAAAAAASVPTEDEAPTPEPQEGEGEGEGAPSAPPRPSLKRWVALSRSVIGAGFVGYAEK